MVETKFTETGIFILLRESMDYQLSLLFHQITNRSQSVRKVCEYKKVQVLISW